VAAGDAVRGGVRKVKPGRGSPKERSFVAAMVLDEEDHPWRVHFGAVPHCSGASLAVGAQWPLAPDVHLVTDGWAAFDLVEYQVAAHGAIIVAPYQSSELSPFHWVNTFIANVNNAIRGTYHHVRFAEYRHRYLAGA
jgi:hypothetical protein